MVGVVDKTRLRFASVCRAGLGPPSRGTGYLRAPAVTVAVRERGKGLAKHAICTRKGVGRCALERRTRRPWCTGFARIVRVLVLNAAIVIQLSLLPYKLYTNYVPIR